jgi:type II secretory pathway component GspD/PulD (secretin)
MCSFYKELQLLRVRTLVWCIVTAVLLSAGPAFADAPRASIVAQDESLRAVLLSLGKQFGLNIAVSENVSGTVTIVLHDVTANEALHAVLDPLHYRFTKNDGVYVVSRMPAQTAQASVMPGPQPVILNVTLIPIERAAGVLRGLYPNASIHIDRASGALIVVASSDDVNGMRAVLQGIDVKNPAEPVVQAVQIENIDPQALAERLRPLYPQAQISVAVKHGLLIKGNPQQIDQIKQLISIMDQPPRPPSPTQASDVDIERITEGRPQDVARTVAHEFPRISAAVAGNTVVLSGTSSDVGAAKALIAQINDARFLQIYRLHTVDAGSVAALLTRAFPNAQITADEGLNAISAYARTDEQQHISDSIAQLDAPPQLNGGGVGSVGGGPSQLEIVSLRSAIPLQSASANSPDPTPAIIQALEQVVPGIKVQQLATPGQLALIGDSYSIRQAKDALAKLDVPAPLVVLDTEILELDKNTSKELGLDLPTPVLGTTYSEVTPPSGNNGIAARIGKLLPLTRTPLSLAAELNFSIQDGTGRVLADPRLTTLSGHTASIRAGDQISILTTTGGGTGTVATQQLQTFNTGVTLDITPLVTGDGTLTVMLHPTVNSLDGSNGGVPEIATREATTTVSLKNNQTLIIGGLIQDTRTDSNTRIPVLGYLPLVGSLFRDEQITADHNELVIVVTPHIVKDGETPPPAPTLPVVPAPAALPTLPPGTALPARNDTVADTMRRAPALQAYPTISPASILVSPVPAPAPSASPGTYKYGALPSTNLAKPTDPAQIFQATVSPTTVQNGTLIAVAVVTTTNVSKVSVNYGTTSLTLGQIGPGMFQGNFAFAVGAVAPGQSNFPMQISAARLDGSSAQISVPMTVGQ